jgi:hypothetical protein
VRSDDDPFDFEDDAPFDIPAGIRIGAFRAFDRMIREVGKSVYRMPASCEMFLRQYLGRYSDERELLAAALRRGVPDRILQHSRADGYDELLDEVTADLSRSAGVDVRQAKWAVEAWATVLGRPPGYRPGPVVARPIAPPPGFEDPKPPISERGLRLIMAGIAAVGGFVGGAIGNGGAYLVIALTGIAVDAEFDHKAPGASEFALLLIVLLLMMMGGLAGAVGAFGGWLFGRGDAKPWAGAKAACGAAFGISCLLFLCVGPGLVTAMAQLFAAFGAAFTAASRGGYER